MMFQTFMAMAAGAVMKVRSYPGATVERFFQINSAITFSFLAVSLPVLFLTACSQQEAPHSQSSGNVVASATSSMPATQPGPPPPVAAGHRRIEWFHNYTLDIPEGYEIDDKSSNGTLFVREPDSVEDQQSILSITPHALSFNDLIAEARSDPAVTQVSSPQDIGINGMRAQKVALSGEKGHGFIIIIHDLDNDISLESDNPLGNPNTSSIYLRDEAHYNAAEKIAFSLRKK